MKVLVTGAAGFIGFHTAKKLVERGDEVLGLDNVNAYYDVRLKEARLDILRRHNGFTFLKADLADRDAVARAFAEFKPERVVNLAAQAGVRYGTENPHAYTESNVTGFLNVLEGRIAAISDRPGPLVDVTLAVGRATIVARLSRRSCERLGLAPGLKAWALVKAVALDRHAVGFA